jgi:hypothetical protein
LLGAKLKKESLSMKNVALAALVCSSILAAGSCPASANITITLRNTFIEKYANRATINTDVRIDKAAPKPHGAAEDGDMHAAGVSEDIGLATVVEIMNANATDESSAVADLEGDEDKTVSIGGYWRLWPEHGGTGNDFTQFGPIESITSTNPPHVFEIHPILSLDNISLDESQHVIGGYAPKDPDVAFAAYDRTQCKIVSTGDTTEITTDMIGYNYVKFQITLNESAIAHKLDDNGFSFFAQVQDPDSGDLIANKVRMVYALGTSLSSTLQTMKGGSSLVVWGIPRIDLSELSYRAKHPQSSDWSLPYEMIIVAIAKDKPTIN